MASQPVTTPSEENQQSPTVTAAPIDLTDSNDSSHLKKVPESRAKREAIRLCCAKKVQGLDRSHPLSRDTMETTGRRILEECGLSVGYLGWTMVILASEFWRDQVAAVPFSQRLLLLPHCMKHAQDCPAGYDEFGLACQQCGACNIGELGAIARKKGYQVLVAEGSPVVMRIILSGQVNAILGVACLNVLEKAIDKILLAGIPCTAIPLLSSECRDSSVDEDWVHEMIMLPHTQPANETRTYVHIMRAASGMFENDQLERLAPRSRSHIRLASDGNSSLDSVDPIAGTEALAYHFLEKGGKHSRPFITLAVYDALTGGHATQSDGAAFVADLPVSILRTAMSIETFHKASLVHDDIEDDDPYRYGEQTLHRRYGVATAINVGDYLIGMGYRLVSRESKSIGPQAVADILDCLADAHTKLSEGQGAELLWRDTKDRQLKPIDALKIYALKTAPAFEAAILSGIRLARELDEYVTPVRQFARNLGVAFQILNDLKDWRGDQHNKLAAGGDILGGRPTVLWALACEQLDERNQDQLLQLTRDESRPAEYRINRVRQIYHQKGVFEKADRLVRKHRARAEAIADHVDPKALRRLFRFLIDSVLADS